MLTQPPDHMFADALLTALAHALRLTTPDEASGLWSVLSEGEPQPMGEDVQLPFGCVRYAPDGRQPKIVPQVCIKGRKLPLGHFPFTAEGAAEATRVREAAAAAKAAGGDYETVKAAAREAREAL